MSENKFITYLLYSVGEIILVVIGILIAVSIDDWNQKRLSVSEELENYQDIINDLREDSTRVKSRIELAKMHQDCYYELNDVSKRRADVDPEGFYDFVVMRITFDPITKTNHQETIRNLTDHEVRRALNVYFANEYRVRESSEEFNKLITEVSRPFILEEMNAFSNEDVFISEKYMFPPSMGRTSLNQQRIQEIVRLPGFTPINSELRMSLGWFLAEIEDLYAENAGLLKKLEERIKE